MNAMAKDRRRVLQCVRTMTIQMLPGKFLQMSSNGRGYSFNLMTEYTFRYVPLQACMHRVPVDKAERGTRWPMNWPQRLKKSPYWLNSSQMGIYGKPAAQDFATDYEHWKGVVSNLYMSGLGIDWSEVRNIMDMRAVYGGY